MSDVKWRATALRASKAELPQIVEAARFGDSVAYEEMVNRCYKPVHSYCSAMGSGFDADDLTQETFLRALKSTVETKEILNLEAFMIHIAKCVCADFIRQISKTRAIHDFSVSSFHQESDTLRNSEQLEIEETLSVLCDSMREVFVLTQLLGFSYEECSAIASVPIGTIRSRVNRARSILQSHVAEICNEYH